MAVAETQKRPKSYKIVGEMNTHEAMVVVDPATQGTYHVVDYDDSGLRRELAALETGEEVDLALDRAGVRANVWQARRGTPDTRNT